MPACLVPSKVSIRSDPESLLWDCNTSWVIHRSADFIPCSNGSPSVNSFNLWVEFGAISFRGSKLIILTEKLFDSFDTEISSFLPKEFFFFFPYVIFFGPLGNVFINISQIITKLYQI